MKNRTKRILSFTALIAVALLLAAFFVVRTPTHAATPVGQSNIKVGISGNAYFAPKSLSCTRTGTPATCSITIRNTTKVSQVITLKGAVVYTLAPTKSQVISYTTAGVYVYGLSSNTKAKVTVTVN